MLDASTDLVREQAYLVERGVRALSIIGQCTADEVTMLRVATELEAVPENAIPFVCDLGNGMADYGFAAQPWVVSLYEWVAKQNAAPAEHRHRILGLLLGYDPSAIASFEARRSGRRFHEA